MELIFEVRDAEEGGFSARALGHAIFTQGETWEELLRNLKEAIEGCLSAEIESDDLSADDEVVEVAV